MVDDTTAIEAVNTIIEYCRMDGRSCESCAIHRVCYCIRSDRPPEDILPYETSEKQESETNCNETENYELLHTSYVDNDGNVVLVD